MVDRPVGVTGRTCISNSADMSVCRLLPGRCRNFLFRRSHLRSRNVTVHSSFSHELDSPDKPTTERLQALADISHSAYAVTATKPVHLLQIRPIVHNYRAPPTIPPSYNRDRAVAWSVGLSVTLVGPAKTAEPIEMPFGLRTRMGPGNHVLDGGSDPTMGGAILRRKKKCCG